MLVSVKIPLDDVVKIPDGPVISAIREYLELT
jgi:hypothetical protein